MTSFECFFIDHWNEDLVNLRSGIFEEDGDFSDDEESSPAAGRSFGRSYSKNEITIRKSFPESWIFDGDLKLGYKKLFIISVRTC